MAMMKAKGKLRVRARKLFKPFKCYLESYHNFASKLPIHFMEHDQEKIKENEEISMSNEENDEIEEEEDEENEKITDEEAKAQSKKPQFGNATRAKTISELKKRLAELRGKKLDYQERLKKKGMKSRLTKKERLEERAKLKKERQKKAKKTKGNLKKLALADSHEQPPTTEVKPKKEPKLMFSKLDVPQEEGHKKRENKDPKRMLQKIEKSQSKLKELEEKGRTETVKKIKHKMTWDKAIQKAEGAKLKDDVELLKKTIRKKNELKKHSKKKWEQRLDGIEQRKKEGQTKRRENIAKKIKDKKQKKVKRSIKKGRVKL